MDWYLWLKALHVVAIIAWMAALLYMPRLFVYHSQTLPGTGESDRFKVMELKLNKVIMTPALMATWLFGVGLLVLQPGWLTGQGWMHAKLLLVLGLTASHGIMARWRKQFAADLRPRSEKFFRAFNEVPTLLMIGIVILVIVKPF